jgi:hypothetical protein
MRYISGDKGRKHGPSPSSDADVASGHMYQRTSRRAAVVPTSGAGGGNGFRGVGCRLHGGMLRRPRKFRCVQSPWKLQPIYSKLGTLSLGMKLTDRRDCRTVPRCVLN